MKKTKTQKGITLIALIITIVVLLIIAVVTIGSIQNSKIIDHAQNAAIQTEINQVKEQLELKKAEILLDNKGKSPSTYTLTLNDLDISDKLKAKYGEVLTIGADGKLYYLADKVLDEEKRQQYENMGILSYTVTPPPSDEGTLMSYVTNTKNSMQSVNGHYNLAKLSNQVRSQYYSNEYLFSIELIMTRIERANYSEDEWDAMLPSLTESDKSLLMAILMDEDEKIYVGVDGEIGEYTGDYLPMTELEALKVFGFDDMNSTSAKIKMYKGTESSVVVPAVLTDELGNVTRVIEGINDGAFSKVEGDNGPVLLYTMFDNVDEAAYNDMTVKDVYESFMEIMGESATYDEPNKNSTENKEKLLAIYSLFPQETTKLSYNNEEDYIPILYMAEEVLTRVDVTPIIPAHLNTNS